MTSVAKRERQRNLRHLLVEQTFASQFALRDALRARGFDVCQATVSRDLNEVGAVVAGSVWCLPRDVASRRERQAGARLDAVLRQHAISASAVRLTDYVLVRTLPGRAARVAEALMECQDPELLEDVLHAIPATDEVCLVTTLWEQAAERVAVRLDLAAGASCQAQGPSLKVVS